jgi:hypothetical protein
MSQNVAPLKSKPLNPEILNSFLSDANRLFQRSIECIKELTEQSTRGKLNVTLVRTFYHYVHALKGTASMIEGGASIVEALQGLEAHLSCQSLTESVQKPVWLTLAKQSFQKTETALLKLQNENNSPKLKLTQHRDSPSRGLLARAYLVEENLLVWFPIEMLLHVFTPHELSNRSILCVNSAWVPIIGKLENFEEELGIGIKTQMGSAVFVIKEALGIIHWSDVQYQLLIC